MGRITGAIFALLFLGVVLFFGFQARKTTPLTAAEARNVASARNLPLVEVRLKVGGEKIGGLKDPRVVKILLDDYHLRLAPETEGSVQMVEEPILDYDALWPSSDFCRHLFDERARSKEFVGYQSADVFSSPLVVASWPLVADALARRGIVRFRDGAYYIEDMPGLLKHIEDRTSWKDMDSTLAMIYGSVSIRTTDPTLSGSGSLFMGLVANLMNGGEPCPPEQIERYLPRIKAISGRTGLKETATADLFEHFMSQGMGAYPLAVVYENQFLEALPQAQDSLRHRVRILYPNPTVWASHPFLALTENGRRLLTALQDTRLQKIFWERHGFRSAVPGAMNDPQVFKARGVPRQIVSAMPAPDWEVMERITQGLTTTRP